MSFVVSELPEGTTSQSHQLATRVEVLVDGEVEETLEDVIDGDVTLDAGNAIRGRLTLNVIATDELIPTGPDSLLAPYGNEIRVYRGVELADRTLLVPLGIYRIDQAVVGVDTIAISGQDRAAGFSGQDSSFETGGKILLGADTLDTIRFMLADADPEVEFDFPEIDAPLPPLYYEEGDDRWEFCRGLATWIGQSLYFNRAGKATVRPTAAALGGQPLATFAEGEGGVLLTAERNIDREGVYNRVVAKGTNPESTTQNPRGEAIDTNPFSPTFYGGAFGQKTYAYSSTYLDTTDQANDAAAGLLARVTGAPDVINFSAVVDPARSPDDVVRIERERLGLAENHILDSVSIPLAAGGTMSATTRVTSSVT